MKQIMLIFLNDTGLAPLDALKTNIFRALEVCVNA